jgi:hypothetical protein
MDGQVAMEGPKGWAKFERCFSYAFLLLAPLGLIQCQAPLNNALGHPQFVAFFGQVLSLSRRRRPQFPQES